MKKYLRYFPHNWFKLRVLTQIWCVLAYLLLALILYTVYNLGVLFFFPPESLNPAPLRLTWTLALMQEILLLVFAGSIMRTLKTLHTVKYRIRFIKK